MSKELNKIYKQIQSSGLRLTLPRKSIIEILLQNPRQAIEIIRLAKATSPKIDKATVYRNLEVLIKKGIVRSFSIQNKREYFELNDQGHHHHLICSQCNKIFHLAINNLEKTLKRIESEIDKKYYCQTVGHSLSFYGICQSCR